MSATARQIELATNALRKPGRALPLDPAEWGRAFSLTPGEAERLVRAERKRRSELKPAA